MSSLSHEPCTQTPDLFAPLTEAEKTSAPVKASAFKEEWEPVVPAPSEPEMPSGAQAMWVYRNAEGRPLFARFRYDGGNQSGAATKEVRPLTYGRRIWVDKHNRQHDVTGWHWKQPAKPLPLYGLDRLAAHPDAPVLLVEGEKAADAGALLFPDYVAVTSGGSTSATSADWSPLSGRDVTIWPDNDEPGEKYAQAAIEAARDAGARSVRAVKLPDALPAGWDVADPLPESMASDVDAADTLRTLLDTAPQAEANVKMPPGYRMTPRGLYFTPDATDDTLPMPIWVSDPFEVIAETRDEGGTGWGVLISWLDQDRRYHQWAIPKKMAHGEGKEISGALEDAGLNCSISATRHLRQFIASVHTKTRLRCVTTSGWHKTEQGPAFVLPNGDTLGNGRKAVTFQTTRAASGAEYATAGRLEDWQREIAAYARGNSRLIFTLSAAFSGPLLDILGEQSGGFHFVGASQTGKSTVLFAAGSVWGKGSRDGMVRSWRGTANGMEGIACETSDTLLLLDEMGEADSREVGEITYMLANNTGKQRAGRNGEARTRKTWNSSFISTGELTLAAKMGEAGRRAMAGQEVRLVNIQASAGDKLGLLETPHTFPDTGALADHIRVAARTYFGTASRAYLDALVKDRGEDEAGLTQSLKTLVDKFEKDCLPSGSVAGQVRSVVRRFGLVAAAGELATAYGVLPWERGDATQAAKTCFQSWLAERGGTDAAEDRQAIEQVRAFIEQHGESRFTLLGGEDGGTENPHARTIARAGYRKRVDTPEGSRWEYLVLPVTWRTEVCKGIDPSRAAKVLLEAGYLLAGDGKNLTRPQRIPGEGRPRVYVVSGSIIEGEAA